MAKKKIMTESALRQLMHNALLNEDKTKEEVEKAVRDAIKSNRDVKKDLEKQVKEIVAKAINTLLITLWQRRGFYETEIKK